MQIKSFKERLKDTPALIVRAVLRDAPIMLAKEIKHFKDSDIKYIISLLADDLTVEQKTKLHKIGSGLNQFERFEKLIKYMTHKARDEPEKSKTLVEKIIDSHENSLNDDLLRFLNELFKTFDGKNKYIVEIEEMINTCLENSRLNFVNLKNIDKIISRLYSLDLINHEQTKEMESLLIHRDECELKLFEALLSLDGIDKKLLFIKILKGTGNERTAKHLLPENTQKDITRMKEDALQGNTENNKLNLLVKHLNTTVLVLTNETFITNTYNSEYVFDVR